MTSESLTATVADPLTDPAPAGWADFVTAQRLPVGWRPELLRTAAWCAQAASTLVLVREAASAEPVAAFHARHVGPARPGRFVQPGRMPAVTLTECRVTPHLSSGVAFAAAADVRDRREAVRLFERALHDRVGPAGRLVAYRALPPEQMDTVAATGRVRLRLRVRPSLVLHNQWSDLPAYLATLPRKLRKRFSQLRREVDADRTIRVELAETIEPREASWLAESVRRRHRSTTVPFPPWPESYFALLSRLSGSRFLTYRDPDGRLLAYSALYDDGDDLIAGVWGYRNPAEDGRRHLYFDQQLRKIEWMVNSGRRSLVLGPGMDELKLRLGAHAEPRWSVVRPR